MSTKDHGDMRFQHRDGDDILNTNPLSNKVGSDPFGSGWNPMVSLNQSENFEGQNSYSGPSYSVAMDNQALTSTSHLVHYQSDSGLGEMVPKLSCFGSGNFSEMVNSFGLPDCGLMSYSLNKGGIDKAKPIGSHSRNDCQNQEDKVSPNQKNKRKASDSDSPFNSNKNELEQQNPSGSLEMDVKNQKIEQNIRGKQTGKQVAENSDSGDAAKDSYIHVRAKRGQATNSHSLAERVRREKISERMRLLQELVPGCNKITGKAVMLDEIINYVQSLQQQVEFLSMKLATVNPEVNIDIEQILSKEILNARSSNAAIHGYQGLRPTHPYPHANLLAIPNTTQAYHSMPQAVWDNDLHNLLQMGFDSNNNLCPSGRPKLDL